ncbi:(p)ppGpp synthetase [Achromobacter spanius]|uniref:RelA/SpoT domain-containing protein n=1 Tax=Achromobacter spanius TaxID=217203 RepID=A0A3S9YYX2_9BURK|nr:RelA/SpoT domain-containing protein [Achromobacter spanius]AZS80685.1 (p)ppGpp synthetase [Achromobacter spanius]MDH0740205.1 RelA/SpoT domain-containing protein [Achromobacter spanius]
MHSKFHYANMDWIKPEYSKGQIDRAGRVMVDPSATPEAISDAAAVVNNWRASHNYPLNTFKVTLRRKALAVDPGRLVAQRIKRMSSIEAKLTRFQRMRMSQMQDIGGARVIVGNVGQVRKLVRTYLDSDLKHSLDAMDDYIDSPKASGYRGVHMVYRYNSDKQAPAVYNGLCIELQFRTRLQHAWATAVETVGTFLQQALKSSQGEERWLRFFALMGSVFAHKERCTSLVPDTPISEVQLVADVRELAQSLNVHYVLRAYQQAIKVAREGDERRSNYFYLLVLEPQSGKMTVTGYPRARLDQATAEYLREERRVAGSAGAEAVLVSVDSIASLERAYPNYFLDTAVFLRELTAITGLSPQEVR